MYRHLFSVLLTKSLDMELPGHMLSFPLTFWRTAKLLSKAAAPVSIPASNVHEPDTFWHHFQLSMQDLLCGKHWVDAKFLTVLTSGKTGVSKTKADSYWNLRQMVAAPDSVKALPTWLQLGYGLSSKFHVLETVPAWRQRNGNVAIFFIFLFTRVGRMM